MGDEMREEFEDVESSQGEWPRAVEKDARGEYILMATANAWNTWQDAWEASRAALVVELPETSLTGSIGVAHKAVTKRCRAAIEAAGVRVKS